MCAFGAPALCFVGAGTQPVKLCDLPHLRLRATVGAKHRLVAELKRKMMFVGAGAVGESILKVMQTRDWEGCWFTGALVCNIDSARARQVVARLPFPERCTAAALDVRNTPAYRRAGTDAPDRPDHGCGSTVCS